MSNELWNVSIQKNTIEDHDRKNLINSITADISNTLWKEKYLEIDHNKDPILCEIKETLLYNNKITSGTTNVKFVDGKIIGKDELKDYWFYSNSRAPWDSLLRLWEEHWGSLDTIIKNTKIVDIAYDNLGKEREAYSIRIKKQ